MSATLLVLLTLAAGAPQRGGAVGPAMLDKLKISRRRVAPVEIKRLWVLPVKEAFVKVPVGKFDTFYGGLDAQVVTNTRKAGLVIEDQDARGTCTIFATKFLAEYELSRQKEFKSSFRMNPEYLNWAANAATNDTGDGSSFPAVVTGLEKYGCTVWTDPKVYSGKLSGFDPKYTPSAQLQAKGQLMCKRVALLQLFTHSSPGMTDGDLATITYLLDEGWPVAVGQQWPAPGTLKTSTILGRTVVDGSGATLGAHTMAIVGYKRDAKAPGGGLFLFRNSWGTDWGTEGYHYMTFNWVRKHTYDGCMATPETWIY